MGKNLTALCCCGEVGKCGSSRTGGPTVARVLANGLAVKEGFVKAGYVANFRSGLRGEWIVSGHYRVGVVISSFDNGSGGGGGGGGNAGGGGGFVVMGS